MRIASAVIAVSALAMAPAPLSGAFAAGFPPANAKPLSAILDAVQKLGVGNVAEAEFDHGRWEVTVCTSAGCQKLFVNARTGAEEGRRSTGLEQTPAAGSTPIAKIVQRVEAADIGVVTDVSFDHGHWKVELAISPVGTR